eukprot:6183266-Pleurochrysis_carterae.AAC.3
MLATQPSLASSSALRRTAICLAPHRSAGRRQCEFVPPDEKRQLRPPGVTSMSHSAPVVVVVPSSRVKWAKISPSAGNPLSDAKMMLTSSTSSGVSAVERDV